MPYNLHYITVNISLTLFFSNAQGLLKYAFSNEHFDQTAEKLMFCWRRHRSFTYIFVYVFLFKVDMQYLIKIR